MNALLPRYPAPITANVMRNKARATCASRFARAGRPITFGGGLCSTIEESISDKDSTANCLVSETRTWFASCCIFNPNYDARSGQQTDRRLRRTDERALQKDGFRRVGHHLARRAQRTAPLLYRPPQGRLPKEFPRRCRLVAGRHVDAKI